MSCTYTDDELEQIAREQSGPEAEMAQVILESRGVVPEDTFEERNGQSALGVGV